MISVVDNRAKLRFEAHLDAELVGRIDYTLDGNQMSLVHTVVPPEYGGKGIASSLTKFALEQAQATGLVVVPVCPFVVEYLARHPEYSDVVANS